MNKKNLKVPVTEINTPEAVVRAEDESASVDLDSTGFELTIRVQKDLQKALQELGFYNGAIDGNIGPVSKRAILQWQNDRGYNATGELTLSQKRELLLDEGAIIRDAVADEIDV